MGPNPLLLFRSPPLTNGLRCYGPPDGKKKLVVAVNAKPKEYEPNSVPLPARPRLIPKQDSTAYIIERILLPPNEIARDGKPRPKRMTYVVGWRDLPAASLLVPVHDILDYVSPGELEAWESALEEELKKDRAELEAEKKKLSKLPKGKRKRGRPPKHSQVESAAVAEIESDDSHKERLTGGALSLSTPKKRRMKDFEGLSDDDDEEEEEEGSPSRQLEQELYNAQWGAVGDIQDVEMGDFGDSDGMDLVDDSGSYLQDLPQTDGVVHDGIVDVNPWSELSGPLETASPTNGFATPLQETPRKSKPGKKKSTKNQSPQKPLHIDGEEQWIVNQIEGDALYDVEHVGLVRYYKVRWEGDWPPDQNPSWEPEENLPPAMLRNYHKASNDWTKKLKTPGPGRPQKKPKPSKPQPSQAKKFRQTVLPWASSRQSSVVGDGAAGQEERSDSNTPQPPQRTSTNGHGGLIKDEDLEDELVKTEDDIKPTNLSAWPWNPPR